MAPIFSERAAIVTPVGTKRLCTRSNENTAADSYKKKRLSISRIGSEDNEKESTTSSSQKSKDDENDPLTQIKKRSCTLFKGTSLNATKFMFSQKKLKTKKNADGILSAFYSKPKKFSPIVIKSKVFTKAKKTPTEGNKRKQSLCEIIEFGTPQGNIVSESNVARSIPCHDLSKIFEGMSK